MLPPAKSTRKRSADLVLGSFRIEGRSVRHRHLAFGKFWIAAALVVHMDGSREEGSDSAPNAAISAARIMHYIGGGESHRSTCCHSDLHAGAQGNSRGGYC
jgi:hypothetical protein